ncbi:MAG: sugar-binding protein [Myxococcota bacterium]
MLSDIVSNVVHVWAQNDLSVCYAQADWNWVNNYYVDPPGWWDGKHEWEISRAGSFYRNTYYLGFSNLYAAGNYNPQWPNYTQDQLIQRVATGGPNDNGDPTFERARMSWGETYPGETDAITAAAQVTSLTTGAGARLTTDANGNFVTYRNHWETGVLTRYATNKPRWILNDPITEFPGEHYPNPTPGATPYADTNNDGVPDNYSLPAGKVGSDIRTDGYSFLEGWLYGLSRYWESGSAFCGDGTCNGSETCGSCPKDCGDTCSSCGNGTCDAGETCSSCSKDCGTCPTANGAYMLQRASHPPVIDGDLSEYVDAPGVTVTHAITGTTGTYKVLWDSEALYFAADVRDATLEAVAMDASQAWADDGVEFTFDTTHDGGASRGAGDRKLVFTAGGLRTSSVDGSAATIAADFEVVTSGTLNNPADVDTGYTLEARIAWSDLGVAAPGDGTMWGFDIQSNDRSGGKRASYAGWFGSQINSPNTWGDARFSSEAVNTSGNCVSVAEVCDDGVDNDCDGFVDEADTDDCATTNACDAMASCMDSDGCCPSGCNSAVDNDCSATKIVCVDNADGTKTCTLKGAVCGEPDANGDRQCVTTLSGCATTQPLGWMALAMLGCVFQGRRRRTS